MCACPLGEVNVLWCVLLFFREKKKEEMKGIMWKLRGTGSLACGVGHEGSRDFLSVVKYISRIDAERGEIAGVRASGRRRKRFVFVVSFAPPFIIVIYLSNRVCGNE